MTKASAKKVTRAKARGRWSAMARKALQCGVLVAFTCLGHTAAHAQDNRAPQRTWARPPSVLPATDTSKAGTSEAGVAPAAAASKVPRWYGYQTLAADVGAVALFAVGAGSESYMVAWSAVGVYALGAPIVHALHDNSGRGAGSFVLRVALPPAAFWIGAELSNCGEGAGLCQIDEAWPLVLVGFLLPPVLDAAVFAYDVPPGAEVPSFWSQLRVVPLLGKRSAELDVSGAF